MRTAAARYEISVDGVVRTHRDERDVIRNLWTAAEIDPQKG